MKRKLLCIAVAIIMILPLAFAAIPMASAAGTLSSEWTTITGGPSQGAVSVEDDGSIKMVGVGGFSQAGILYNRKAPVDGLELKLRVANATVPGQISAAAIVYLSGAAIDDEFTPTGDADAAHNIFAGNSYSVMCDTSKTAAYVIAPQDATVAKIHGGMYSLLVSELGLGWDYASLATVDYAEFTIKFEVEGDKVELYVNGTKVEGYGLDKANIVDANGNAYLAVSSNGYGSALQDVTLVTINGKAANEFNEGKAPARKQLTAFNVDGVGASNGTVSVDDNGAITFGVPAGMHWPQAGVAYSEKVAVDGAEFVINAKAFTNDSPNGYAAIHMCADQFSDFGIGILGGRTYAVTVPDLTKSFSFTIYGSTLKIWIDGAGGSYDTGIALTPETDITVKFVVEDDAIKFLVNGEKVQVNVEGEPVDVAIPAAGIIDADSKAYLCLAAVGYGGSGCEAFTVKTINGVAAADYDGAYTYTGHKAEIVGAQYRTEGAAGIRFLTEVALNGVNNNDSIVKMGTLIIPADKLGTADLVLTENGKIGETSYLDIVARNYYEKTDDRISFTAVLTGIPQGNETRDFVAVSYIEYADGTVTYSEACVRNIAGLMA